MKDFIHKHKLKLIVAAVLMLFSVYIINGINEHTVIPDHIHSIDDKAPEERTDEDNIVILRREIQNDPENVDLMIKLSDLYIKTNNNKSAKITLQEVLKIDPYHIGAKDRLSQLD